LRLTLVRPKHDDVTSYLFEWCNEILKIANRKNFKISDLNGEKANKERLAAELKNNPDFVVFNCHGDENRIYGHDDAPLFDIAEHKSRLNFVYARSCCVGSAFKKHQNKVKSFVGYSLPFFIVMSNHFVSTPLKDPLAKPFMETSNAIPEALMVGNSANGAVEKARTATEEWVEKLETSSDPSAMQQVCFLQMNLDSLVVAGDAEAKLVC